jgi:5-methylcytosine-specific restriction endonuclease McrA
MSGDFRKRRRLRLDPGRYRELKMKILERDGWRCQCCGRRDQLQIHHMIRRSQSGGDCEQNLIVLCGGCHRSVHSTRATDQSLTQADGFADNGINDSKG